MAKMKHKFPPRVFVRHDDEDSAGYFWAHDTAHTLLEDGDPQDVAVYVLAEVWLGTTRSKAVNSTEVLIIPREA